MDVKPKIVVIDWKNRSHHYTSLIESYSANWVLDYEIDLKEAKDADLCICSDEFFNYEAGWVSKFKRLNIPVLHIIDGVIDWKNNWENPRSLFEKDGMPLFQPVLSDKIACLGNAQARILESWGNIGKCEIVGCLRFDRFQNKKKRKRQSSDSFRILIMTANTPGFTDKHMLDVTQAMRDLKKWFEVNPKINGIVIEPVWRITGDLPKIIGIDSNYNDSSGKELAELLLDVDAVITAPSTTIIESMLLGLPVASIDYSNSPKYINTAWNIFTYEHILEVILELIDPPYSKMLYQDYILHDNLECGSPALPRMITLINELIKYGRLSREQSQPLILPDRILDSGVILSHSPDRKFDLTKLYPNHPVFNRMDVVEMQVELGHLRTLLYSRTTAHDLYHLDFETRKKVMKIMPVSHVIKSLIYVFYIKLKRIFRKMISRKKMPGIQNTKEK